MSGVRLMCENLIDASTLTGQTCSSEQTSFPDENIQHKKRRSKVWRSNGYWEITAANKVIIFQETIGVNLTATIAESNYASDTAFLTAIKTALDAAGDSTYTVTRDTSTNKIKITSNGSGGGGVFRLICTSASFTAATTLGYSTAADLTGALTYTADTLKIHTSEWIRWDLGTSTNPKAFILVGLRNSSIKISPTATITLEGNGTDTWAAPSYSQALTYNDNAIVQMSSTGLHSAGLRYWRLKIVDTANSNGYVEIGSVYLGTYYSPDRGSVQFPLITRNYDRSTTVFSESGQPYSDRREIGTNFDLNWFGLKYTDVEQFDEYFRNLGTSYPWFFVLDTDAVFSSNANFYTRMVRWEEPFDSVLISPNVFTCNMPCREEL